MKSVQIVSQTRFLFFFSPVRCIRQIALMIALPQCHSSLRCDYHRVAVSQKTNHYFTCKERPESTAAILCLHCRVIDIRCALWKLGGFRPGEAVFFVERPVDLSAIHLVGWTLKLVLLSVNPRVCVKTGGCARVWTSAPTASLPRRCPCARSDPGRLHLRPQIISPLE